MKINWGFGIVVGAALFVAFILNLVYRCSQEQVDLVSDRYYEKEIRYQEQIDKQKNLASLDTRAVIGTSGDVLSVLFPAQLNSKGLEGEIVFFRPDNSKLDFTVPVAADANGQQVIPVSSLKKGRWNVQLQWRSDGVPYYQEEKIILN